MLWLLPVVFVAGVALGLLVRRRIWRTGGQVEEESLPADLGHLVDLVRRAHGASFAALVRADGDPVTAAGRPEPSADLVERALATARVALGDRRQHLLDQPHAIAAVGDGDLGVTIAWEQAAVPERTAGAADDLRRLLAGFQVHRRHAASRDFAPLTQGPEALESAAFAVCEAARVLADRPTAVVLRDALTHAATIVAVSHGADRRLIRAVVAPDSVAGRACMGDIPVAGHTGRELFGQLRTDRRRREEQGVAFPLHDGRQGVGALVVFASPEEIGTEKQQRLMSLAVEEGPRLSAAAALRAAETRALTDELTGLWNRRALERAIQADESPESALLLLDLDHFKTLNDNFGHTAGDAALRHVGRIIKATLREQDLAARVGGEEFALWLPHTSLERAREVADRIRTGIAETRLHWAGAELGLTCSIGLAGRPATVTQNANLYSAADAALYRAKEAGRNRTEAALPSR